MHARSTLATLMVLAHRCHRPSAVIRASGPTVTVEDLGPTDYTMNGRGVNASGFAVGYGNDGTIDFGFTHGATWVYVPVPDAGDALQALAINDAGVVVGRYTPASGFRQPYRYDSVSNVLTAVPICRARRARRQRRSTPRASSPGSLSQERRTGSGSRVRTRRMTSETSPAASAPAPPRPSTVSTSSRAGQRIRTASSTR